MKMPFESLRGNEYPGRGILIGKTENGENFAAYFIMGRSAHSRNRVFVYEDGMLFTRPIDERKVADPSLILYPAIKRAGNWLIVTNGDQTQTICDALATGQGLPEALAVRSFEPDAPHFTPRISALLSPAGDHQMSILRKVGDGCVRSYYSYRARSGVGHLLHTYKHNGDPLPPFEGAPVPVHLKGSAEELAHGLWDALNADNKIALFVLCGDGRHFLFNKYRKDGE